MPRPWAVSLDPSLATARFLKVTPLQLYNEERHSADNAPLLTTRFLELGGEYDHHILKDLRRQAAQDMSSPHAIHHALLRPCVLHILRAAGYHSTKPSVLDTLTDIAGRYMAFLAASTAKYASINHEELGVDVGDVRMAMEDAGLFVPEKVWEDQVFDDEEDDRGVEDFIRWCEGSGNRDIRRVALEGQDDGKEDYLTILKKKHDKGDEESRYDGTILGKESEPHIIPVEGGEITSLKEWADMLHKRATAQGAETNGLRRASSELSSIDDQEMSGMDL